LKLPAKKLRSAEGAEIAEAALVLPVVFIFLLGIVWFGRAFNIYSTITQAAQQGAITAARSQCGSCGNNPATTASVTNIVEAVMKASSLDTNLIQTYSPNNPVFCPLPYPPGSCTTAGDNVTICSNLLLNPPTSTTTPPICGSLVSFKYPVNLPFTFINFSPTSPLMVTAQAQSRMEN
jgi:hypothetical protein